MVHYDDYINKCFILNTSTEPTNFIRSDFDYGVRQRRAVKGYVKYGVKLVLGYDDLVSFQKLWSDLDEGTLGFYSNAMIHGDISLNKTIRFTSGYSLSELGNGRYALSTSIELLKKGVFTCPNRVPQHFLHAEDGLVPC